MPRLTSYLKLIGVELVSGRGLFTLRCQKCGAEWTPNLAPDGRPFRGSLRCPNGCSKRRKSVALYRKVRKGVR